VPFTPFLKSFNLFTEAEISKIQNTFSPISFEEQDIMLHEGEICDRIFYMSEGVMREFSDDESEPESTLTHWILGEGEWVYQVMFQNNLPPATFKLSRPLKASYIRKETMKALLETIPNLAFVIRTIYERYLLQLENRNAFHRIKNAEQRLEVFEKTQPGLSNR
jgi:CRP/FNR family transcriptional regulator